MEQSAKILKSTKKVSQKDNGKILRSGSTSQQLLKRQREWVYLAHFLALTHLHPLKTISGQDDGQEPDFTCVFRHQSRATPYYVGIELTTLPRLRDRLGNDSLMLKRWYWQSMLQVSTGFTPSVFDSDGNVIIAPHKSDAKLHDKVQPVAAPKQAKQQINLARRNTMTNRLQQGIAKTMCWLPNAFLEDMADTVELPIDSLITQADIDAVMTKKAHKVEAYRQKRPLDEIWLLVHTNEAQENGVLSFDGAQPLLHHSEFNRVFVTLYPNNSLLQLSR